MILILAAFALLVVAIGVAVVWTQRALRLTREGVTGHARIEEARGEAGANRLLTASLNPLLLQWQAIQKLQDNINIALVPSDGGLILDVGNLPGVSPQASPEPSPAP